MAWVFCYANLFSAEDLSKSGPAGKEASPGTPPPGAAVLWNGKDLTGWASFFTNAQADMSKVWHAKNGVLWLAGKPLGYLRTDNVYSNYHLHVEWRWPATNGNSGVFVHIHKPDALWPASVECQLKSGAAGEMIGHGGVDFPGPMINGKKRAKITTPSEKAIGEWNAYDIYCRGADIDTTVNGVHQKHIESVSVTSGGIGLQLEGFPVEFRNLWLMPL